MKYNPFNFEIIHMDASNRMFRPLAIGLNKDRLFIRFDLWAYGLRITLK